MFTEGICCELYVGVKGIKVAEELLDVSALWMTQISSMYLSQILGGLRAVLMALTSKSFMNRLVTKGLVGDPIAAPCTCL